MASTKTLPKARTGILGLDEITAGGFPAGRPTLICASAGCGKTVLAMEFIVRGIREFGEPGLFISLEESVSSLIANFESLGFDLHGLIDANKLAILHINLSGEPHLDGGEFSLDALMLRMRAAIDRVGAKRIAVDTLESLFATMPNQRILRWELARLFDWLRDNQLTTVLTAERGDGELTREGLEEYVSDCVLVLDHRITEQTAKRRLRIVKYRGSSHGLDEYPFLITNHGVSVIPVSSVNLDSKVGKQRVSSGVSDLDQMLNGEGYFKGSTILISGKAGTGKSSLGAAFVHAAASRAERTHYFAFEESESQIVRNMQSIGVDLQPMLNNGTLSIEAYRPTLHGLEEHLLAITTRVIEVDPACVLLDPVTNFLAVGNILEVKSMLTRVLDDLKDQGITVMMTALTSGSAEPDETIVHVSSLVDTWIALDNTPVGSERRRALYIIKSRGMNHSQSVAGMTLSEHGINLEPYSHP